MRSLDYVIDETIPFESPPQPDMHRWHFLSCAIITYSEIYFMGRYRAGFELFVDQNDHFLLAYTTVCRPPSCCYNASAH